jgi:hypothetical protein
MTNSPNAIAIGVRDMEQGDNLNEWGDPNLVNNQTIIVRMIHDWNSVALTGDKTVSESDYSTSNETEYQGILLTGSLSSAATYTVPSRKRTQIYKNETGQTVTVKTSAGSGVAIPTGFSCILRCDGSNVISEPLFVNGAAQINGALQISGILSGVSSGVSGTDAVNLTQVNSLIAAGGGTGAADGTVKVDVTATAGYLGSVLTASGDVVLTDNGDTLDIGVTVPAVDTNWEQALAGKLTGTFSSGTTAMTANRRYRISGTATGTLPTLTDGQGVIVEFTVGNGVTGTVGRNSQTIDGESSDDTYAGDGSNGPVILYSYASAGAVTSTLIGSTP